MRAVSYRRTGPAAEVLEITELPDPAAGPGEVLVRVLASGINPADVKRRGGWLGATMDHPLVVPHGDGAGIIEAVGEGVGASRIGERVWLWNAQGGYGGPGRAFGTAAEKIALPAAQAVRLPDGLDFDEGACLGVPALTAHRAVHADGPVDGATILVAGAGGAVAHFAVQFAVAGGARVIGTAGSKARAAHARDAGAETVIDRHSANVAEQILDLTGGQGVDRIIEVDFGANLAMDAALIRPNGVVASYSSSSVPEPVLRYYDFAVKGANIRFIQGFNLPEAARADAIAAIDALARQERLKVAVGRTFPLGQAAAAHECVETGSTIGNVVVRPNE